MLYKVSQLIDQINFGCTVSTDDVTQTPSSITLLSASHAYNKIRHEHGGRFFDSLDADDADGDAEKLAAAKAEFIALYGAYTAENEQNYWNEAMMKTRNRFGINYVKTLTRDNTETLTFDGEEILAKHKGNKHVFDNLTDVNTPTGKTKATNYENADDGGTPILTGYAENEIISSQTQNVRSGSESFVDVSEQVFDKDEKSFNDRQDIKRNKDEENTFDIGWTSASELAEWTKTNLLPLTSIWYGRFFDEYTFSYTEVG